MSTRFTLFTTDEFSRYLQETTFNRIVKIIQNHHTLEPSYRSFNGTNHLALLKGMEEYHVTQRGFSQIAQNLTTFPDGRIALCRPLEKIPAGIVGANQGGICIEHLGNFDTGKDTMNSQHRQAIVKLNALLCREFRLTPSTNTIVYHHWYDLKTGQRTDGSGVTKTCPGTDFFGGNSVADAQAHFIPFVLEALSDMVPVVPAPQELRSAIVTASSLNVRSSIGTNADIVKSLAKGILVHIYEENGGWCRVHPTEQHWVSAKYLQ